MKVIITDCDHTDIKIEEGILTENNIDFKLLNCKTEEELIKQCKGASVFINQYAPLTDKVFKELTNLKMVVRYGVGVNNIDLNAAKILE